MTDVEKSQKELLIDFITGKQAELDKLAEDEKEVFERIANLTNRYDPKNLTNTDEIGDTASCLEKKRKNSTQNPLLITFDDTGPRPKVDWKKTARSIVFFDECVDCPGAGFRPQDWPPCFNDRKVRELEIRNEEIRKCAADTRGIIAKASAEFIEGRAERKVEIEWGTVV